MATHRYGHVQLISDTRREAIIPNGIAGMLIFVLIEAMMFAGLISAFTIVSAGAVAWPPPDQPRLPIEATAFNTLVLLASGGCLYLANRAFRREPEAVARPLVFAMGLGAFFVFFQGIEWVRLIGQGLTLTSSALGSFFYLIVGMHALHAVIALGVLAYAYVRLRRGWLPPVVFGTAQIFWYFVVGLWPFLYLRVYL